MQGHIALDLDNSYQRLPGAFFAEQRPHAVPAPRLIVFNAGLADELGMDTDAVLPLAADIFSGNLVPSDAAPLSAAYAGHQFGHFVPQLGDGRAVLLGERVGRDGLRRDIQLKGAGPTPFSRGGDGRAALGPVLREYLVSEAMHALGVPTTRALAAVATGDAVYRETALPGAVLTRVASSHIRVGTFQYFAARQNVEALRVLTDYVIGRHYPAVRTAANPALALLEAVARAQARLIAQWMSVGFIHGVMNTDNMAVSGETIDYGPCAFMDAFDPLRVFSSIDRGGRYAYAQQPRIGFWNLARFAETLLPLIDAASELAVEQATAALQIYPQTYDAQWLALMRAKCGLFDEQEGDRSLIEDYLRGMHQAAADFTLAFRHLGSACHGDETGLSTVFEAQPDVLAAWLPRWRERLARAPLADRAARMNAVNPLFIPRNHRVEEALAAAAERDDLSAFHRLHKLLKSPFTPQPGMEAFAEPPPPSQTPYRTFCGT